MIAYKVVNPERGSIMVDKYKRFGEYCPEENKYYLKYPKGQIVEAVKGSLGIFCFETKESAIAWLGDKEDILMIEPLTEGHKPKHFQKGISEEYLDAFYENPEMYFENILRGTICFDKIKVLD